MTALPGHGRQCLHTMLAAEGSGESYAPLCDFLVSHYGADRVQFHLFTALAPARTPIGPSIRAPHDHTRELFRELFSRDRPLCDSLQDEHLRLLFGASARTVRATLLVPIVRSEWEALLVLGSYSADRYAAGPSLSFLRCICEVYAAQLEEILRQD